MSIQFNAGHILTKAKEMVTGDRDRQNGAKIPNHENIARLWDAYLRNRLKSAKPMSGWALITAGFGGRTQLLTAKDVALMMVLFKVARTQLGEHNIDDYTDMAGYAACAGEIADFDEGDKAW